MRTNLVVFHGTAPQRSETPKPFNYFSHSVAFDLFLIILFPQLFIPIINLFSILSVSELLTRLASSDVFLPSNALHWVQTPVTMPAVSLPIANEQDSAGRYTVMAP